MKKKLSLAACLAAAVLAFSGCQSTKTEAVYNQDAMEQMADFLVSNFSQMSDEQMDSFLTISDFNLNYTLLNAGLDVDAEVFQSAIEAWQAAEKECGNYEDHGDYTLEEKTSGAVLKADTQFDGKDAVMEFEFDENSRLESLTVNANYTTGEILKKAGLNTVLGMGTVFVMLVFMAFVISLIKYIPGLLDKMSRKKEPEKLPLPVAEETAAEEETEDVTDDAELVAVITAAIQAAGGTSEGGFVVRSIRKRRKQNHW